MEQAAPERLGKRTGVAGKRIVVMVETAEAAETEAEAEETEAEEAEAERPRRKGERQAAVTDQAATEAEPRAVREELATMKPRRPSGNTATGKGVTRVVKKIAGTPVEYMQKIIERQMTRGEKMVVMARGVE